MKNFAMGVELRAIDRVTKVVQGVAANTVKALHNVESTSERMQARLSRAFRSPIGGIAGAAAAYFSYEKLKEGYLDCTKAATEQLAVERKLDVLMRNAPGGTEQAVKAATEYADVIERQYHISHKLVMGMESQLATYRLTPELTRKMIVPILNWEESLKGIGMSSDEANQMTRLLGRGVISAAGSFGRAGFTLDAHEKKLWKTMDISQRVDLVTKKLDERFKGLAARNATSEVGTSQGIGLQIEKMKEDIGKKLLPLRKSFLNLAAASMPLAVSLVNNIIPAVIKIIPPITKVVNSVVKWAKENPKLASTILKTVLAIAGIIAAIGPVLRIIATLSKLAKVITAVVWVANQVKYVIAVFQVFGVTMDAIAMLNPFGLIIAGAIAVIAIGYLVYRNWAKVKQFFVGMWKFLLGNSPAAKFLRVVFPIIGAAKMIIDNWKPIKDFFVNLWKSVTDAFNNFINNPAVRKVIGVAQWSFNTGMSNGKKMWNWATTDSSRPTVPTGRQAMTGNNAGAKNNGRLDIHLHGAPSGTRVNTSRMQPNVSLKMGVNNTH